MQEDPLQYLHGGQHRGCPLINDRFFVSRFNFKSNQGNVFAYNSLFFLLTLLADYYGSSPTFKFVAPPIFVFRPIV